MRMARSGRRDYSPGMPIKVPRGAAITGWGKCMPPAVLTNADIATFLDTSDVILEVGGKFSMGNVRQGNFVPYIEGALGLFDFNGNDLGFRVGIGASYMVTDSTSVDPYFSYLSTISGDKLNGHIIGLRLATRF